MRTLFAATLALAVAACASPPPAPVTTASAADPNAPVCHSEIPTGSILPRTVCVSAPASKSADAANERALNDLQDHVQHSPATRPGTTQAY